MKQPILRKYQQELIDWINNPEVKRISEKFWPKNKPENKPANAKTPGKTL